MRKECTVPLLSGLEFTQQNLRVAYRASADPQEVTIDVVTAAASRSPVAPVILRKLLDAVQRGSAPRMCILRVGAPGVDRRSSSTTVRRKSGSTAASRTFQR